MHLGQSCSYIHAPEGSAINQHFRSRGEFKSTGLELPWSSSAFGRCVQAVIDDGMSTALELHLTSRAVHLRSKRSTIYLAAAVKSRQERQAAVIRVDKVVEEPPETGCKLKYIASPCRRVSQLSIGIISARSLRRKSFSAFDNYSGLRVIVSDFSQRQ
ncbi:hypothetical protein DAEQUDRAFT_470861 [Daedalea quercina L-15889]|uniref:Uncharacterized protein n=1 Tax=Daedalea quercina L-15889 TaxID=1314783 RepID=A0A165MYD0_9APHY|nr:hypothetical protein DAEQUDRAFT_470861 [Daedalea quercina L-15889]